MPLIGRMAIDIPPDPLQEKDGKTSIEDRRQFAAEAFDVSSHYDTAIFNYFNRMAFSFFFGKKTFKLI